MVISNKGILPTNGAVNKRIPRVGDPENTLNVKEVSVASEMAMLWFGLHKIEIFGPCFHSEPNINAENYIRSSRYSAMPKDLCMSRCSNFQEDDTPSGSPTNVPWYLNAKHMQCWVGKEVR